MNSAVSDDLYIHLAQLIEAERSELIGSYQRILREALFNGRSKMRPNMLKKIALDEVDAFSDFLHQLQPNVIERGVKLHESGLNEQPLLRMGQVTRQFFLTRLMDGQAAPAMELIDAYQEQVIQGYIQALENSVFNVQEKTRHAFERVLNRGGQ